MYESNRKGIIVPKSSDAVAFKQFEDDVTPIQLTEEYKWAINTFPALHKYKNEHNIANLQKLMVEISDFCRSVYASTQNEKERTIYFGMLEKLNKK
jgi:hypothetical protein